MVSVAKKLLGGFDIAQNLRPSALEDVLIGLISTLSKNHLLRESINDIERHTHLKFNGELSSLELVASHPDIPYMHRMPEAISVLLKLIPIASVVNKHEIIDMPQEILAGIYKRTRKRWLDKIINALNSMDIGTKIYLPYGNLEKLGIITYSNRDELFEILKELDLPIHIQDKIAK